MTPARFTQLAERIAGRFWRVKLGPQIGRCRTQVYEYATGKRKVPEPVARLMEMMAEREG